ncbi:MAG: hypothetical protein JKY30_04220, partial [Flavobacteriales bacterium]|nr:hypothetical protein [Flavobacteriales bacterium]
MSFSIFLLIGILFTGNGFNVLDDIFSGSASQYNKQLKNRFTNLRGYPKGKRKVVAILPLKVYPKCLFVSDITDNPKDWTNQAYNLYFRIDST